MLKNGMISPVRVKKAKIDENCEKCSTFVPDNRERLKGIKVKK
jgi:hypothetical protein